LAPIRQIAENLGVEGSIVVGKVLENKSQTWGFDALTEQYVDMLNAASLIRRRWCGSPCRTLRRSPVL
jgi:chaperonin GroEL (HSP60 family)